MVDLGAGIGEDVKHCPPPVIEAPSTQREVNSIETDQNHQKRAQLLLLKTMRSVGTTQAPVPGARTWCLDVPVPTPGSQVHAATDVTG